MSSELNRTTLYFRFIREEHTHHLDLFDKGRQQMLDALKFVKVDPNKAQTQHQANQGSANKEHQSNQQQPEAEDPKIEIEQDVKKLYRKIVQETHPDKMINTQHGAKEIEKRKSLYQRAVDAFKQGDDSALIEIAIDLDLTLDFDDNRVVKALAARCRFFEKEINKIKMSPEIHWMNAPEEEKIRIIREICVRNGWIYVTDEQIVDSVKYATGMHPGTREDVRQRARQRMQSRRQIVEQ